jgi:hypothetical protein
MSVGFVWIVILKPTLAVPFVDFAQGSLSNDSMHMSTEESQWKI